jgi:outer membrane protein OmpA-like peptidoglycan-associated protein
MRKITLLFIVAGMLSVVTSQAQRYFGIATSNWSGTNGMYLNPANIADSRHKFTIDLFSMNMMVDNNLAIINPGEFIGNLGGDGGFGDALEFQDKDYFNMLLPVAEVRGPGFMVSINNKHSFAISTRFRAMMQIHNFSQNFYKSITESEGGINQTTFQSDAFNVTGHSWGELGLSYGGVIWNGGKHFVKGGFTLRRLMGVGYFSVKADNIDVTIDTTNARVYVKNTNIDYASNLGADLGQDVDFFGSAGSGWGGDLGVVYEFRPNHQKFKYDMDGKTGLTDNSKNKYMLRVSAALTDIGSIKYTDNNFVFGLKSGANSYVDTGIIDNLQSYDELKAYGKTHGFAVDSGTGASETKVKLPTALVLGLDYHIVKGLYANLTYVKNMTDRTQHGNSVYSQVTLTPRFDVRAFSFGIPLTYNAMSGFKWGFGLRAGGFILGSDDIMAFLGDAKGMNFYLGLSVPFSKKKPKDSDGDAVSNRKDKCKNEKGVWEMKGCPNPDKDGDGILDKDDKCPDIAGSKTAMGCPDADLDGVADAEDRCPQQAGAASMQGCPDRDNDNIADLDDACPDQAGLAQFKGCPDTDGDGLADNEDGCPNAAGPVANQGCPDTDNDGVLDNVDKCPTVAGTKNNFGCPEVSVQVKKRLAFAATAIQFDLGKSTIKKTSNKVLDEVVKILNDYPDYVMSIDGHTDNVGDPAKNMQLSKDRAESVKNYFTSKGISGDRLMANGFGDTKPVMSNKTAAGRAKNRRVAMDLKLKD